MSYAFDPEELREIVQSVLGQPIEQLIMTLVDRLAERYPKHIDKSQRWMLNNAGGAMGAMTILHGSVSEYLILFGSPIGTEGHTGRFWADDYFFILDGEQWFYHPGDLRKRVFRPGDVNHMGRGLAGGYRIPEHCWALEYARGFIPSMLPFGLADAFTSTFDLQNVSTLLSVYAKQATRQILRGKI